MDDLTVHFLLDLCDSVERSIRESLCNDSELCRDLVATLIESRYHRHDTRGLTTKKDLLRDFNGNYLPYS